MTRDIKATVAELVAKWGDASKDCEEADAFVDQLVASWPSLLAELRRCWAKLEEQQVIVDAAVRYREKHDAYAAVKMSTGPSFLYCRVKDEEAREDLFAALPPRKPSGGEEAT